jgi:crotonobetainyl-CoA:carnitine CoA-transferase CaiB-like acyl-CoA transferase
VLDLIGVAGDARFATFADRIAHRSELDALVEQWIGARPATDVLRAFETAEAAIAPVYTMADLAADPHVQARDALVEVDGVTMQGVVARLSRTPGRIRHAGRPLGADTEEVLAELEKNPGRSTPRGGLE